ncbi:MAG: hypothetical protein ACR2PI_10880 [Hyphomicrobiaceae bacterium]
MPHLLSIRSLPCFSRLTRTVAAVGLASTMLAGCYNVDATVTFKDDGTAAVTSRLDFPRDAEHVANLYKAIMELRPETSKYFNEGLCHSVEKLAATNPQNTIDVRAREYTTDTRYGCGFLYEAGDSAILIDKVKQSLGTTDTVFKIEQLAPRRARIEMDFSNMPDLSQMMPGLIMLGAMKYGGTSQGMPNMDAVNKISKAYAEAALAMTRMSAPNNHIQLTIKARKIVDTNGTREGNLVKFRWSWEEFTRLMVKPTDGKAEAKVYYAVIDY